VTREERLSYWQGIINQFRPVAKDGNKLRIFSMSVAQTHRIKIFHVSVDCPDRMISFLCNVQWILPIDYDKGCPHCRHFVRPSSKCLFLQYGHICLQSVQCSVWKNLTRNHDHHGAFQAAGQVGQCPPLDRLYRYWMFVRQSQ